MNLANIYKDLIIDYSRNPKNFVVDPNGIKISANNPLCGDNYDLYLKIEGKKIVSITFFGSGCAISKSSASIMTEILKDKNIEEALHIFTIYHEMLTNKNYILTEDDKELIGKLQIFENLNTLPMRVKCATTSWHPLMNYLREHK